MKKIKKKHFLLFQNSNKMGFAYEKPGHMSGFKNLSVSMKDEGIISEAVSDLFTIPDIHNRVVMIEAQVYTVDCFLFST